MNISITSSFILQIDRSRFCAADFGGARRPYSRARWHYFRHSGLKARCSRRFAGGLLASVSGSAFIGLCAAHSRIGSVCTVCMAWRSHHQRGNQIVSGAAIQFQLRPEATVILGQAWFRQGGRTPQLRDGERLPPLSCHLPPNLPISRSLARFRFQPAVRAFSC